MKNLFVVVGGLGKNIIWTSLIEQLNVKCEENISVMTPWPFVFYNNKNIDRIEPLRDFPFNEQFRAIPPAKQSFFRLNFSLHFFN